MAVKVKRNLYFGNLFNTSNRKNSEWAWRSCEIARHPEIGCSTDWIYKYDILMRKGILNYCPRHTFRVPNKRFGNGL